MSLFFGLRRSVGLFLRLVVGGLEHLPKPAPFEAGWLQKTDFQLTARHLRPRHAFGEDSITVNRSRPRRSERHTGWQDSCYPGALCCSTIRWPWLFAE